MAIPGLGNGVLQDILWHSGLHPKAKLTDLTPDNRRRLYAAVKETLQAMASQGGRSTEYTLGGEFGGYSVQLSARTSGQPCPACSTAIESLKYMGGSVYFCPSCQPLQFGHGHASQTHVLITSPFLKTGALRRFW